MNSSYQKKMIELEEKIYWHIFPNGGVSELDRWEARSRTKLNRANYLKIMNEILNER